MPHASDAQLRVALEASAGILALAAGKLKITRQAVFQRVKRSPSLQAFIAEIEERLLDNAEAVIADAIMAKDKQTTRWYLERKGRARGYVTRQEQTGADGAPLQSAPPVNITVNYVSGSPEPKTEGEVL